MLESAQQINNIDLDYYVIYHQQFKVACIILCNFQNTNSQILPTKTLPDNPGTDYEQKKERKKFKTFLQAFTTNFSWISLSCIIYRTSTNHAQTD